MLHFKRLSSVTLLYSLGRHLVSSKMLLEARLCARILYYNNPSRCSCAQSILFRCSVTLHVSGAFHTHHQEYINCIYSLRYRSYIGAATFLQRGRVFISPQRYSTCFGCFPHPSSGVHQLYLQPPVQVMHRCRYLPPTWPSLNMFELGQWRRPWWLRLVFSIHEFLSRKVLFFSLLYLNFNSIIRSSSTTCVL